MSTVKIDGFRMDLQLELEFKITRNESEFGIEHLHKLLMYSVGCRF